MAVFFDRIVVIDNIAYAYDENPRVLNLGILTRTQCLKMAIKNDNSVRISIFSAKTFVIGTMMLSDADPQLEVSITIAALLGIPRRVSDSNARMTFCVEVNEFNTEPLSMLQSRIRTKLNEIHVQRVLALAMAFHPRLGAQSGLGRLTEDLFVLVL